MLRTKTESYTFLLWGKQGAPPPTICVQYYPRTIRCLNVVKEEVELRMQILWLYKQKPQQIHHTN